LVEGYTLRTGNDRPLRSLLSSWAQAQPEQAIAYIDSMDEKHQLRYYQSVYGVYLNNQPEQAIDWVISRFDDSPIIAGAALRQSVSAQSIDYALHILETTNNPGVRSNLITSITTFKTQTDQQAALDWLQNYRNDPGYEPALLGIIGRMAYQSPDEAAQMLTPILDHKRAAQQVGTIASNWYKKDAAATVAWIDRMTNANAKDQALTSLIHATFKQDPELAASYLKKIETPFKREDASLIVAVGFLQQSEKTADEIIEELNLTGNAAARVRESASQILAQPYLN
jgi:hypothetical protein